MMPDDFSIREAAPEDERRIVEFNLCMAQETEGKLLPLETLGHGVRRALADPARGRYFLACRGADVVGQLMLTFEWSDWRNGYIWWIQSVYVQPAWRRHGVLKALYDHVRQEAQDTPGVVGLRLYVEQHNTVAQQAYRRLGMQDAGYLVFEEMFP